MNNTYTVDSLLSGTTIQGGPQDGLTQDNSYDGSGQRITKDENGTLTNYFYQGGSVLYTTDANDAKTSQNFLTPVGSVIDSARYAPSDISYYLYNKDIRNSTASILDETGAFAAKYSYDEFGQTSMDGNFTFANEVCYTGGIYDWDLGQYYLNARYYDPEIGRFLSEDTYRGETNDPNSWQLYAYCTNNPINYVDPSGHWGLRIHENITGAAYSELSTSQRKYFKLASLKSGSIAPDGWITKKIKMLSTLTRKYHGYNGGGAMDNVIAQRISNAAGYYRNGVLKYKYNRDTVAMASYQVGIALHTQQDYFAHHIMISGKWTWCANYKYKTRETHHDTFDNMYSDFINGEWKEKYNSVNYMSNPRIRESINKSKNILRRFINRVS